MEKEQSIVKLYKLYKETLKNFENIKRDLDLLKSKIQESKDKDQYSKILKKIK